MNRENLAWAAGFFDGEGHTRHDKKKRTIRIQIPQTKSPELLLKFKGAVGVGVVRGPYKRGKENWSDYWAYSASSFQDVQAVVAFMWPWLGRVKKQQAIDALRSTYRSAAHL